MKTIFTHLKKRGTKWSILCLLGSSLFLHAQDQCKPIGWASYGGNVTGGGSTKSVTVTTLSDLQSQVKIGGKVIYVSGTMGEGVATRIVPGSNTTIIGMPGATIKGGFDIKGVSNVIMRNLKIQGPGSVDVNGVDCITIDNSTEVWIDHCDISDGQDGNLDIKKQSNNIAITWCKFHYTSASSNHQFNNLFGHSDDYTADRGYLKITLQYNWWADGVVERMPRVRFGQVHVVNNLFTSAAGSYCVRAGFEADILVESNAFIGVKNPIDLYEGNYTGVTEKNNLFTNTSGTQAGDKGKPSFTPPYSLGIVAAHQVQALVSDASCGAGATMDSPTTCGCGLTTSLEETQEEKSSTSAYPNPFEDRVTLSNQGDFEYSILDISGVEQEKGKGNTSVLVGENLDYGVYLVKLISSSTTSFVKIEKK